MTDERMNEWNNVVIHLKVACSFHEYDDDDDQANDRAKGISIIAFWLDVAKKIWTEHDSNFLPRFWTAWMSSYLEKASNLSDEPWLLDSLLFISL